MPLRDATKKRGDCVKLSGGAEDVKPGQGAEVHTLEDGEALVKKGEET